MAAVSLKGIEKVYPNGFKAVHGVDLEVRDGEFMVFVGPSGCAKSTLLRMIAGLESITGGDLTIGGKRVNDLPAKDRGIAMVFQNYALYPHMKVRENLAFGLKLAKLPKPEVEQRVAEAAKLLEMEHLLDRYPKQLSGGQAQRVAVGRAIVKRPGVFLFDEPLSNLDAKLRANMRSRLTDLHRTLKESGQPATVIYVTHDQVEAMTMGERICVLKEGTLQQVDSPTRLYASPANAFVGSFIGSPEMNLHDVDLCDGAVSWRNVAFRLTAQQQALTNGLTRLKLGIRPEHLSLKRGSDEDVELAGDLKFIEHMGAEVYAHVQISDRAFTARIPADRLFGLEQTQRGAAISLFLAPSSLHLFDTVHGGVLRA
jgi:oligogalacturonide transport system ATP-binding protein